MKQEAFCQYVSRGKTLAEAYRLAYQTNGNPNTVNGAASKLMMKPLIRDRVEVLLKELESHMHRDAVAIRRHVFAGLMAESRNIKAKPSERISALIALGKIDIVGMFRELHSIEQVKDRDPAIVEQQLRDRLKALFTSPHDPGIQGTQH